jgi:hypothetical protein
MRKRRLKSGVALLAFLPVFPAMADVPAGDPVGVRVGDHTDFGRVVFDFVHFTGFRASRDGDRLVLRFDSKDLVASPPALPRNVRTMAGGLGQAELTVAPGAEVRTLRVGDRIALDVIDPAQRLPVPPPVPAARPAPQKKSETQILTLPAKAAKPAPPPTAPVLDAAPLVPVQKDAPPQPAPPSVPATTSSSATSPAEAVPASAPPAPVTAAAQIAAPAAISTPAPSEAPVAGPSAVAAIRATVSRGEQGSAVVLPFGPHTAAAAFRRGGEAVLVFDEQRPIDLAGLHNDPVFGQAAVQLLQDATVIRLPLQPDEDLELTRVVEGWRLAAVPRPPALHGFDASVADGQMRIAAQATGQVVVVPDPLTGGNLLVGTQREPGQGMPVERRTPDFILPATWQGLVAVPLSDRLVLRSAAPGFILASGDVDRPRLAISPLPIDMGAMSRAAVLTRRFDLPDMPVPALQRRLQAQVDAAAVTPALGRLEPRLAAAQTMLALGFGPEAEGMVSLGLLDDPRGASDPTAIGISAIGAMLAGRMAETQGINDPRLDGSDEVSLWRAVRMAQRQEGSAGAAQLFAATLPLALAYPEPLRRQILPLAAETMVLGGAPAAAASLLAQRPQDGSLALARAMLAEVHGDRTAALAGYDALATGNDRQVRIRAATRAMELRLASGIITPAQAADTAERLFFAWRGDQRELNLRLRAAQLRAMAGQWRQALALLHDAQDTFPEDKAAIQARLEETFAALLKNGVDHLAPLELVATLDDNSELISQGPAGDGIRAQLADKLLALDLPARADPVLRKLMDAAPAGPARAELGAKLARLRLNNADPAGALTALANSAAPDLAKPLETDRAMLTARALAAAGDGASALASLGLLDTPEAQDLRATLLERAHDWPAAQAAVAAYAGRTVPKEGRLDDVQARTLIRLASDAAQAGDEATLAALRTQDLARVPDGAMSQMLAVLTEHPVQRPEDLPRAAQEATSDRAFPAALKALEAPR